MGGFDVGRDGGNLDGDGGTEHERDDGEGDPREGSAGDVESTGELEAEAFDVDQTFAESGSQSDESDVLDVGTPDIPVDSPLESLDDGPPSRRTRSKTLTSSNGTGLVSLLDEKSVFEISYAMASREVTRAPNRSPLSTSMRLDLSLSHTTM